MLTLKDGPAKGTYMCQRAPHWLRAVVDGVGRRDVLDLLDDTPRVGETISVYRRVGEASNVHINMGRRKGTGFYARAEYEWLPDVDGESVRETREWQAWCVIESNTEGGNAP